METSTKEILNTYCGGFKLNFKENITKKQYIELCQKISNKLNNLYELPIDTIKILPEAVTEGGMVFQKGNSQYNIGYKTMRHSFTELKQSNRKNLHWPRIDDSTCDEWVTSDEILIFAASECNTFLKAFKDASAWTLKELEIFKECFEEYEVKVTKIPKAKDLIFHK